MATTTDSMLRLERVYSADVDRVWEAWTKPDLARQWLAPAPYVIPEIAMDLRVGGAYRVVMENPQTGVQLKLAGEYREIARGQRLVYSWVWQNDNGESPETLVTVTFAAKPGATEVTVVHELFPSVEMRDQHIGGWTACLETFKGLLQK